MVRRVIGPVHGQMSCRQQVTPQACIRKGNKLMIRASDILISADKPQSTEKMSVAACQGVSKVLLCFGDNGFRYTKPSQTGTTP